jgi:hypothetical protein
MRLPVKALAAFIASPQGRRAIKRARARIDTPENRRKLQAMVDRRRRRGAPIQPI